MKIPFNKPSLVGREFKYIKHALLHGQLSGDGVFTRKCSAHLEHILNVPRVLMTPSCTHALELAYAVIDLQPDDEVILPSFTFPSTANAFVLRRARPRFVDIRRDTLNIDDRLIEGYITSQTRAISPVHYAGVPCQMDVIMTQAKKHRLVVVEDAAQALGARFNGQAAGAIGHMGAFSFHETKNVICGEGGALALKDPLHIQRAEIIRQKGTNRAAFYRGEVDKYSWVESGSSHVPSELQTAFLYAQLHHLGRILKKRKRIFLNYYEALLPLQKQGKCQLPYVPQDCVSAYHIFYLLMNSMKERDRVIAKFKERGIHAVFHFFPLHLSKMGERYGYRSGQFPVTENVSRCLVRLPFYNTLTEPEQAHVIRNLKRVL
ncbi:MAG: dTDP-4-amino-4,6-dideoxygalactose transaminase [Elusimicrobia bacterium]|nr:dTDP-4-amino-4,6-dideoxygalactose transaminase [Candidatus Obscuribacterium magneticum]